MSDLKIVKGIKLSGKVLGTVQGVITVGDVLIKSRINASNLLDATITTVSFIPRIGWAIGGGYFLADLITIGVTGESIGQQLDDAVGEPLVNWEW